MPPCMSTAASAPRLDEPASRRVALCCVVQKPVNEILKYNEEEFGRDLGYAVLVRDFGRT
jgi:hypothetical protein